MNDDIKKELGLNDEDVALMQVLLAHDPLWQRAFDESALFSGQLVILVRAMRRALTDTAQAAMGGADSAPIESLDLKVRPYNVLKRQHVHTVGELCQKSWADLADMRNMGSDAINDVETKLALVGRTLRQVGT